MSSDEVVNTMQSCHPREIGGQKIVEQSLKDGSRDATLMAWCGHSVRSCVWLGDRQEQQKSTSPVFSCLPV
jgi:hypothetical protein